MFQKKKYSANCTGYSSDYSSNYMMLTESITEAIAGSLTDSITGPFKGSINYTIKSSITDCPMTDLLTRKITGISIQYFFKISIYICVFWLDRDKMYV